MPLRAAIAATLSLGIALTLHFPMPLNAFITAIVVTDLKPATSRQMGLRRVWATIIGAGCGALMTHLVPGNIWGVGAGALTAMILAQLLKAGEGVKVAGYISGIVLLDYSASPYTYALMRFVETVTGVLVAWGISYIPKLVKSEAEPSDRL